METIFICEPKNFPTPANPVGFNIEGISCLFVGDTLITEDPIKMAFKFYVKDELGNYILKDGVTTTVAKSVNIPNVGHFDIPSMLISSDKTVIYQAAVIFAGAYGYTLLSYENQTFLNQ